MPHRLRSCVECSNCKTRYLIAFSPYRNGAYLVHDTSAGGDRYLLYCSCGRPASCTQWSVTDLRTYAVSKAAYDRGYGNSDEIVLAASGQQTNAHAPSFAGTRVVETRMESE